MSWSIWAFVIAMVVSFITMGFVGALVYLFVSPVLRIKYPPMNQWNGDWVWPANIIASLLWSLGFLIAGAVNYFLKDVVHSPISLKIVYLSVLWVWGLLVWTVILKIGYKDH
jgi:MFS family permease